jgi:hypothetical protein
MKIKSGTYTNYKGYELKVHKSRYEEELPIPEEEKPLLIYYSETQTCPFDEFIKSKRDNSFYKVVHKKDLSNAFQIFTYCIYKGFKFKVTEFEPDSTIVNIETYDINANNELKLYSFTDWENRPLYSDQVRISELEKLWEERKPTEFNLPMPEGLEEYKEIEIPKH